MSLRGRSYITEETTFFVTTTLTKHYPLFRDDRYCDILLNNIKHYQDTFKFDILGYVIMPTHFHWIVNTNPLKGTISDVMRDIKKYSAKQIIEQLQFDKRNSTLDLFAEEAKKFKRHEHKIWAMRFHDEVIRNNKMFWVRLKYIHNNPVKAGLVSKSEEYKYSSARNYIRDDHSVLKVNTEFGGVDFR